MTHSSGNPKFLTRKMGEKAIEAVFALLFSSNGEGPFGELIQPKRRDMAIVILYPQMDTTEAAFPGGYSLQCGLLASGHFGNVGDWEHDYVAIALSKASQHWDARRSDDSGGTPAHLLFEGDTPYWGSVNRQDIIVAASGIQPWFDRLAAGMVADLLIAMAHDAWENSDDKKNGVSFLT